MRSRKEIEKQLKREKNEIGALDVAVARDVTRRSSIIRDLVALENDTNAKLRRLISCAAGGLWNILEVVEASSKRKKK